MSKKDTGVLGYYFYQQCAKYVLALEICSEAIFLLKRGGYTILASNHDGCVFHEKRGYLGGKASAQLAHWRRSGHTFNKITKEQAAHIILTKGFHTI